jgi:competence protein ComEC
LADKTPGAYFYLADKSLWVIVAGYLLFAIWLTKPLIVSKKNWLALAGAWAVAFLVPWRWAPRDLQITFLSVGHGSCVVLETPGKEVIVYDAGSISGPEITRRKIAPFLWNKGIQRVDYLFLSHADLDHFNAVPSLQKMFPIGQVIVNPGFFQKITPGVKQIQKLRQAHGLFREAPKGTSFEFTSLKGEVLHPPSSDFPGNENSRSLVLEWMYKGHRIMLTGDLAGPGLTEVTRSSIGPVDLLMAPHHGSASSLIEPFLQWANPDILVASQSANDPQPPAGIEENYKWFSTAKQGAIQFEFHKNGVAVESFVSQSRKIIPGRKFRE